MKTKEAMERYKQQYIELYDICCKLRVSARNRLVWFVAIAGFVMLYGKNLWDSIANTKFTGISLVFLILPWIVALIVAIFTHIIIDVSWTKENIYFANKIAEIDLYIVSVLNGKENLIEYSKIIKEEDPVTREAKTISEYWGEVVKWSERITFFWYLIAFLWALAGPFVISCNSK